jgi:hypothetical protein
MKYRSPSALLVKLKYLLELILPPVLYYALIYLNARRLHKTGKARLNFTKVVNRSEKCLIIANGPSFNNIDPGKINKFDCIVMNSFWHYEYADELKIVALCLGDPLITSVHDFDMKAIENTKTDTIVLDASKYKIYESKFPDKNFKYVACHIPHQIYFGKKIKLHRPFMGYQTSAQLAIMVALQMGYKSIGLVGFDHTWLSEMDRSSHFYDLNDDKEGSYKFSELGFTYLDRINASKSMFEIYLKLRNIASNLNAEIINYTKNSYLDVFERGNPSLFERD